VKSISDLSELRNEAGASAVPSLVVRLRRATGLRGQLAVHARHASAVPAWNCEKAEKLEPGVWPSKCLGDDELDDLRLSARIPRPARIGRAGTARC